MSPTNQPAIKLEKTVDLEKIFEKINHGSAWELLNIFDKWPLDEIRRRIIRGLLDWPHEIYPELAGELEERIRQLHANHERDYWKGFLSWYIANSPSRVAVKAIEFAINFSEEFREESEVAKEISGRLKVNPGFYWEVPSLRRFFDALISGLAFEYSLNQWIQVERAIRRIVQVRDTTYFSQVISLFVSFERKVYKLREYEGDEFTFGQNLQFLKDATLILKQAQQKQMPDLSVAIGSYLREQADLAGSVIIRLEYQQESDPAKLMVPVEVIIRLELTDPAEAAKLAPILERCHVEWWGEGFSGTKFLGTGGVSEGCFNPKEAPPDGRFQCGFSTFPSSGSNRFWLTFFDGKREFARVARYLVVG